MAATAKHAARVLGLTLASSAEEVRRVRRKLAFKYHPDRATDLEAATRHMARINAAADTLIAHFSEAEKAQGPAQQSKADRQATSAPETGQTAQRTQKPQQEQEHRAKAQAPSQARRDVRSVNPACNLARHASAAYRKVLEQIGGAPQATVIDMRTVSFA